MNYPSQLLINAFPEFEPTRYWDKNGEEVKEGSLVQLDCMDGTNEIGSHDGVLVIRTPQRDAYLTRVRSKQLVVVKGRR